MSLKLVIALLSLPLLFVGCSNSEKAGDQGKSDCPSPQTPPPKFRVKQEGDFFEKLKTLNITDSDNTITFQTKDYNFIFSDTNQTFLAQVGSYKPENKSAETYEEAIRELVEPPYRTIELEDKTYRYRVVLDPNPFPDFEVEPKKVVLELIAPEEKDSQKHTLYTLKQVKEKQFGIQLGLPKITATVINNNQLYRHLVKKLHFKWYQIIPCLFEH